MMGRAGSGTSQGSSYECQIRPRQKELRLHLAQFGWQHTHSPGSAREDLRRGEASIVADKVINCIKLWVFSSVRKGHHTHQITFECCLSFHCKQSMSQIFQDIVVDKLHKIVCFQLKLSTRDATMAHNNTNEASRLKLDTSRM